MAVNSPDSYHIRENQLIVEHIESDDISVVRMMKEKMNQLNISNGDYILLKDKKQRSTVCIVLYDRQCGMNNIKMNPDVRINLRVMLGDVISVFPLRDIDYGRKIHVLPIDDTIQGKTCNLFSDYLQPYFGRIISGDRPLHEGDRFKVRRLQGVVEFKVIKTEPKPFCIVAPETIISYKGSPIKREQINREINIIGYNSIGGYKKELIEIREAVELSLRYSSDICDIGMQPLGGILLYGPPGTGKSLIANATAIECGAFFIRLDWPEIINDVYGSPENCLRKMFSIAKDLAPAIIFLDDIDIITRYREEINKGLVSELICLLDDIRKNSKVVVLAATNRLKDIPPELRGFGRFDREICIGIPDVNDRREILYILTRRINFAEDVNIEVLANKTCGFVGSDLASLCTEAVTRNISNKMQKDICINNDTVNSQVLTMEDFESVLSTMSPDILRKNIIETASVSWEDIGGLENIKNYLQDMIKFKENVLKYRMKPARHILLCGPPGCGKTLLAKAIASKCDANFFCIRGPELLFKCISELVANLTYIFEKAKRSDTSIIFIDEFESIARITSNVRKDDSQTTDIFINQLLIEIDSIKRNNNVFILSATNRPDLINNGIFRSSRIDEIIYIPLPDKESRKSILKVILKKIKLIDTLDLDYIAEITEGFSGADLSLVCKKACILAIKEEMASEVDENYRNSTIKIQMAHFHEVLKDTRPSVHEEEIKKYIQFLEKRNT